MLMWLDIETTGLDEKTGHLLEVGMIALDDRLVERGRISVVIKPGVSLGGLIDSAAPVVREMHDKNSLWNETLEGMPIDVAEMRLCGWFGDLVHDGKPPMCGSSVHFDRKWIARHMPKLERMFLHRNIDVSTLFESYRRFGPNVDPEYMKDGTHRSLGDLDASIAAYRWFLNAAGWTRNVAR